MSIELAPSSFQGRDITCEGSSSRELHDGLVMPDTAKGRGGLTTAPQVSWIQLARAHTVDYIALATLAGITLWCEGAQPFSKVLYHANDQEYWKYSYPLHEKNTVPAWTVPLIATAGPLIVLVSIATASRLSRVELHNVVLGLFSSVLITACITNLVKLGVGRPRPNFSARCWPDGKLKFSQDGIPECAPNAINPEEGQKSFPSGHTSWSTSGMAYLSFWLLGHLRCFNGSCQPWRLIVSLLPLAVSVWIGITRLQDYWHHWEDVVAGFLLAFTFAYLCYRLQYHALMGAKTGELASESEQVDHGHAFADLEAAIGI